MKRILFIILLLFSFYPHLMYALKDEDEGKKWLARTRFNVQTLGKHETTPSSISGVKDVNTSVSTSIEFFYRFHRFIELGAGVEYQFARERKNISGGFNFIPIYAALKVPAGFKKVNPYLIGRIGYNFFRGDDLYMGTGVNYIDPKGGLCYSIGGGANLFSFWLFHSNSYLFTEIIYSVNRGNSTSLGSPMDIDYSKLDIIIGLENYF
jgi:hypothetical protein